MVVETFGWNPLKHFLPGYWVAGMTFNRESVMLVDDIPGQVSGARRKSRALRPGTSALPRSGAGPRFANCTEDTSPSLARALVQFNFRNSPNRRGGAV